MPTLIMRLHILLWISFLSGAVVGSEISWYLCKASSVASVADIFSKDFNVVTACPTARVPGTILANTATAGQGDLYYDRNLAKIPDIHDVGSDYYTYYYVGKFMNPSAGEAPKVLMTFNGVNYLPLFYVNGVQLHDVRYNGQHTPDSGMFRRHILELSGHLVDGENMVAVLVYPPTHVGDASNGGQGGDHDIARNGAISQYVAGWDWIQATPDRNTGLWDTVDIEVLEINVTVANPAVVTKEIDYDTNVATVVAELQLMNLDTNLEASSGVLEVEIIDAEEKVVLSACEVVPSIQPQEILDFTTSLYEIDNAHLWWPYTHGDPYLYDVSITYYQNTDCKALSARRASDTDSHSKYASAVQLKHGVRLIEGYMDSGTKGHAFKVNGQRVFIVGGNWIATDQLLRYTDSHSRYHTEVALHRDMGFNLIRVWGGGLAERNAFYAACDSLGVLVHQEFWMTGDNNGRWAGNYSWPDDHTSYLINAQDTILRLRKHTSLLLYCGGNELNPRGLNPNPEIARGLATLLGTYDSSRYYIESSMAPAEPNMSLYDPTYALAPADGPYNVLLPEQWYNERNPGLANYSKIAISFQPEVGSVSTPVLRSLKRFLPPESLTPEALPSKGDVSVDTTWNYHKYITYTTPIAHPIKAIDSNNPGSQDAYGTSEDDDAKKKEVSPSSPSAAQARQATTAKTHDNEVTIYDHIYSFSPPGDGSPIDVEEYAMRAQMVQYEQFRALFEGYLLHQWEHYAAVLFWKSQSPWPALRGGLYDYYLDYTGGYWGVKQALEMPVIQPESDPQARNIDAGTTIGLHALLNPKTLKVSVVNRLAVAYTGVQVHVEIRSFTNDYMDYGVFTAKHVRPNSVLTFLEPLDWPAKKSNSTDGVYMFRIGVSQVGETPTASSSSSSSSSSWSLSRGHVEYERNQYESLGGQFASLDRRGPISQQGPSVPPRSLQSGMALAPLYQPNTYWVSDPEAVAPDYSYLGHLREAAKRHVRGYEEMAEPVSAQKGEGGGANGGDKRYDGYMGGAVLSVQVATEPTHAACKDLMTGSAGTAARYLYDTVRGSTDDADDETTLCGSIVLECPDDSPMSAFMVRISLLDMAKSAANLSEKGTNPIERIDNTDRNVREGGELVDESLDPASIAGDSFGDASMRGSEGKESGADNRILPTFYSANYLTLVPGESRAVLYAFRDPGSFSGLKGSAPADYAIELEGWTVPKFTTPLRKSIHSVLT